MRRSCGSVFWFAGREAPSRVPAPCYHEDNPVSGYGVASLRGDYVSQAVGLTLPRAATMSLQARPGILYRVPRRTFARRVVDEEVEAAFDTAV